jgi:hypothetical protein
MTMYSLYACDWSNGILHNILHTQNAPRFTEDLSQKCVLMCPSWTMPSGRSDVRNSRSRKPELSFKTWELEAEAYSKDERAIKKEACRLEERERRFSGEAEGLRIHARLALAGATVKRCEKAGALFWREGTTVFGDCSALSVACTTLPSIRKLRSRNARRRPKTSKNIYERGRDTSRFAKKMDERRDVLSFQNVASDKDWPLEDKGRRICVEA